VFFFDLQAALRYLDQLEQDPKKQLASDRPVVLQRIELDPQAWEHVLLQKPEGWRVARLVDEVRCAECGEVASEHPSDTPFVSPDPEGDHRA
jgi:hypothetical protein